ncbi:hypothetical protein ACPPVU_12575 [Mucilaginibacter sp. McL0603]|uniref:hypothetical protein n=1 Tax=Mucilaginibacter sp. McL0603 TaxID=3415670 RepID=UPI003CEB7866
MEQLSAASLADLLPKEAGNNFIQKNANAISKTVLDILKSNLQNYTFTEIQEAYEKAATNIRISVDWETFFCLILNRLPGQWKKLTNNPGISASTMFLLTDGTVLCQQANDNRWKKLRADTSGSYINGTWSDISPSNDKRLYYASAVLSDGRLIVCGGEYGGSNSGVWSNKTEIYDPVADTWTEIAPPTGWGNVGDSPSVLFPDGRLFIGKYNETKTAIYDPGTNAWTAGADKPSTSSEESWVLLPDNTVITVRCDSSQRADKYIIAANTWVDGGTLPQNIIELSSSEIGAAVLLNNGNTLFVGANGRTAIYTPPAIASNPGTWVHGPGFPPGPNGETIGSKDAAGCLMTNGRVLIAAGPVDGSSWLTPTYFYEYNGSALHKVADPSNNSGYPYEGRMLLLPNGQILFTSQTNEVYLYTYYGCINACWKPYITSCPSEVRPFHTYTLQGTQFNGLSQAVGYGDDAASATNYPLVRIKHLSTGRVTYCRTFDHSSMGVATGSAIQTTNFGIPFATPEGISELKVIANGIASPPRIIDVRHFRFPFPIDEILVNILIGNLADGPLWVLSPNGPKPIDPWGPKYKKEVKEAHEQIRNGLLTLQRIGNKLFNEQIKLLEEHPAPIPDESNEDEEEKEKKKSKEK